MPEYAVALHGIARAAGTTTTVNALSAADEMAFQSRIAGARFLVTVPELAERAPRPIRPVSGSCSRSARRRGRRPSNELLARPGTPVPDPAIDPATHLVALPFSSGTTGFPKGVMLTKSPSGKLLRRVLVERERAARA